MKKYVLSFLILVLISFSACEQDEPVNPKVQTEDAVVTSGSTFTAKATISTIGTIPVLDYGFVYSRYDFFDVSDERSNKVSLGSNPASGPYQKDITVDNSNPDYWNTSLNYFIRAFLTNEKGTVYGAIKSFTFPRLTLASVTPQKAKAGDVLTITGENFSPGQATNTVKFNNVLATVLSASPTQLTVEVPSGIPRPYYDYSITITVFVGIQSAEYRGFYTLPVFSDFSPKSGTFGNLITVPGSDFYGHSFYARLGDLTVSPYYFSDNSLTFAIPAQVTSENFTVTVVVDSDTDVKLPGEFSMTKAVITSMSPEIGPSGSLVTLTGSGFNIDDYYHTYNTVKFGTEQASIYDATSTTIRAFVPTNLAVSESYDVVLFTGLHTASAPTQFTVGTPSITDFSPETATNSTYVQITGTNFGNVQGTVLFGSVQGYVYSWTDTSIQVQIPQSYYLPAGTYQITVNAGGQSAVSTDNITIE
jgi:hypothetical protein